MKRETVASLIGDILAGEETSVVKTALRRHMEVETKNAALETMAVTIQALTVSGKQMTLAVFRQLPVASHVDNRGNKTEGLNWWGIVRYSIKDEGDEWLVAERGGRLVRCPLLGPDLMLHKRAVRMAEERLASASEELTAYLDSPRSRDVGTKWTMDRLRDKEAVAKSSYEEVCAEFELRRRIHSVETDIHLSVPQLFIAV